MPGNFTIGATRTLAEPRIDDPYWLLAQSEQWPKGYFWLTMEHAADWRIKGALGGARTGSGTQ